MLKHFISVWKRSATEILASQVAKLGQDGYVNFKRTLGMKQRLQSADQISRHPSREISTKNSCTTNNTRHEKKLLFLNKSPHFFMFSFASPSCIFPHHLGIE
jgi:hypothetical protein